MAIDLSAADISAARPQGDISAASVPETSAPRQSIRLARSLAHGLAITVVVFLVASFITYGLGALSNASPAATVLGDNATPADIIRMNHQFGLDQPFLLQYATWLGHVLTGNLGTSYFTGIPVADSIKQALPVDLSLAFVAVILAVVFGGGLGVLAAYRQGGALDRGVSLVSSAISTIPPFVVGIALIVIFSVTLKWLPSGGFVPFSQDPLQWLKFIILPSIALSLDLGAGLARQVRNSLVGALRENYVTGATVRGLGRSRVVLRHGLRNAAGPALVVLGMGIPQLLGGAIVAETIFALPGMGQLALQASQRHDVPVIQGVLVTTVVIVLVTSIVVNLALLRLNPAARRGI